MIVPFIIEKENDKNEDWMIGGLGEWKIGRMEEQKLNIEHRT